MKMRFINVNKFKFSSNKHVYLTKEGIDKMRARLDYLAKERYSMCNRLRHMDPKEKAEYILSADEIKMLQFHENEIQRISEVLQNASLLVKDRQATDVRLGSTVKLRMGGDTLEYTLVDPIEADPSGKKISKECPLGKALLGRKARELVKVKNSKGKMYSYEVLAIA
jgi:transcription elongation factor GreA